ncbi:ABC transporter ATP-binding protein [Infirmifilum uzonense]|jgi:spermidine/putrescine ABC transporter ATP-binding subunit|uniref:ABC transporter ATP-binding protein n=1 Tax=Infirmifilum uzonense TaxID=1550241 RepID=UPI00069B5834|nr:ABC transporter ATP-binding protein [Infirmifilum uzonense]
MVWIKILNVTKVYGKVKALDNVSLEIRDGELFTMLGPSGCGKTTLLRIIAGFEVPEEGKVFFADQDVTFVKPYQRNTAMVFQNYALWPHMTVFENVAYGLKIRRKQLGLSDEDIERRVRDALKLVRLEGLEDRYPLQLSGGQQQRVALARALVVEPKVLLLDEPLSNLDAKLRIEMREEIKRIQSSLGITTVYVTHDQEEAMSLADRIAVMNKGKILQVGTPKEIYSKPNNLFVATFIGRSTYLVGIAREISGEKVKVSFDGQSLEGFIAPGHTVREGDKVAAIMKTEDFKVDASESNALEGIVEIQMFIGMFNQVKVRVGNQRITALLDPALELSSGQKIRLAIKPSEVSVFPVTGWEEESFA